MKELIGVRIPEEQNEIVTDVVFTKCFWPAFDSPTRLFPKGSSGLKVQGPPTPRNIIFPDDTEFLLYGDVPTRSDCFFLRTYDESGEEHIEELSIEAAHAVADSSEG